MRKTFRSRKTRKTRKHRGGSNNNNNNNNNNKEKRAEREEPIRLRQSLLEAIEENDIDMLKIFVEQPTYLAVIKEGLESL
jgi:hypothetical protein